MLIMLGGTGCATRLMATGPLRGPHDGRGVEWAPRSGTLFVEGPSPDDVNQGELGNCFFVASLSALAAAQPERVERALHARDDGLYDVTLFSRGRPVTVTVDAVLPQVRGAPAYLSPRQPGELWGMLFEKAYASWRGTYRDINHGDDPARVLRAVSGLATERWSTTGTQVFDRLRRALSNRSAVVASSHSRHAHARITPNHAYTVLATEVEDGTPFVVLRNPWGTRSAGGQGDDEGRVRLRFDQFERAFWRLTVLPPSGAVVDEWERASHEWDDADQEWDASVSRVEER
jgi:hypothetical protein